MQPKLFDTHTHFNFNAFKDDSEETMRRTIEKDVWFINVGAESRTSQRAAEITSSYPSGVYAAVGLHPIHTYDDKLEETINGERIEFITRAEDFKPQFYANLIENSAKIVAVGETGLDYFHIRKFDSVGRNNSTPDVEAYAHTPLLQDKQKEIFTAQIELAFKYQKPLILHCRPLKNYDAYYDMLAILKENKDKLLPKAGVVHCFVGNLAIMQEFLELGFYLGFNGIITFTDDYNQLIINASIDKIVLETDSPWLTPVPYRGKRNESIYVAEVAKKIGQIKKLDFETVANKTTENALRLFRIT